jgi:hypothetical protein
VPLVAAALCPHPPVLVPELAAGAAPELDDLRGACRSALAALLAAGPEVLVVLGSGPDTREYPAPLPVSFTPFGLVPPHPGAADRAPLPLSLTIGAWLCGDAPVSSGQAVAGDAPVETCVALGSRYAREPATLGLLVMGDGSACRTEKAPGYLDPRAEAFDAAVTKALAEVDAPALLALDPVLAAELMVAGRAPWQVLAAAAGQGLSGEVLYDAAPYGVNYTVATWR